MSSNSVCGRLMALSDFRRGCSVDSCCHSWRPLSSSRCSVRICVHSCNMLASMQSSLVFACTCSFMQWHWLGPCS